MGQMLALQFGCPFSSLPVLKLASLILTRLLLDAKVCSNSVPSRRWPAILQWARRAKAVANSKMRWREVGTALEGGETPSRHSHACNIHQMLALQFGCPFSSLPVLKLASLILTR